MRIITYRDKHFLLLVLIDSNRLLSIRACHFQSPGKCQHFRVKGEGVCNYNSPIIKETTCLRLEKGLANGYKTNVVRSFLLNWTMFCTLCSPISIIMFSFNLLLIYRCSSSTFRTVYCLIVVWCLSVFSVFICARWFLHVIIKNDFDAFSLFLLVAHEWFIYNNIVHYYTLHIILYTLLYLFYMYRYICIMYCVLCIVWYTNLNDLHPLNTLVYITLHDLHVY